MSDEVERIDIEEDLDYELDVEMDEDELLQDDKCENEVDLSKQMSLMTTSGFIPTAVIEPGPFETSSTSSVPLPTSTTTEPLPASITSIEPPSLVPSESFAPPETLAPPIIQSSNDFWSKSLSTFANVLQNESPANNFAFELEAFQTFRNAARDKIEKLTEKELRTESMPGNDVVSGVNVDSTDFPEQPRQAISFPAGTNETKPVVCDTNSIISSSSSSTSSVKKSKKKKNKRRNIHSLLNGSVQTNQQHQNNGLQSLMSVNTTAFSRCIKSETKDEIMNVVLGNSIISIPAPKTGKKVPFVIQAQSNGHEMSRTVVTNPLFGGFSKQNKSIAATRIPFIRKKVQAPGTSKGFDLRDVVINKRKSSVTATVDSIAKIEDKKEIPHSIASTNKELSDEDRGYLMEIEKQKAQRQEILRLKEWKRDTEGWQFLED